MKVKRQNHSVLFRGMVLAIAFAMAILCAPIDGLIALASLNEYTDYSYMTIGRAQEEVSTTVTKGQNFVIPNAYIGGSNTFKVGKVADGTELQSGVKLESSKVTVSYSSYTLENYTDEVTEETDLTNKVVVTAEANNYGYFVADRIGVYTITYSYTYKAEDTNKTYTNSYELKVNSELAGASINFEDNDSKIFPSVIDLALAKSGETYRNLNLPTPTLTDENGEEIEDVQYVTSKDQITADHKHYVVVTANGGVNGKAVSLSNENGDIYISGDVFKSAQYGAGKYTIRYAYYFDGNFVVSTTKSTQVYSEDNKYYTDYQLKLELASDWTDNGQTGVESKLPTATGVTSKDSKPASENVAVSYTVKVFYKATNSDKSYELISADEYNTEDETVVLADGTLADATKFKPLKDGWYTFVYTIKDFYGNEVSSSKGVYEFANIKDEQNPTPVVYDASNTDTDTKYEDVSYKLATRSVPNSVIVYAIGIDDNVSKAGDEGVVLTRKIMTDDTVSKLTISDYNEYNLVFNYRNTTSAAYTNLLTNNYLIRKQAGTINSDTGMLTWLKNNGYLIVVDNANAETIYNIFNSDSNNFFANVDAVKDAEDKLAAAKAWFKTAEAKAAGFAYIDVDETFGAYSSDNGMGTGQYYIHYIAKDAAGNEKDVSKSMYIGSYEDNDAPEIKFGTTLSDSYLPNATISFDVPSASDNYDTNMLVKTMYRYLDKDGNAVTVRNKDEEKISTEDLTELWADLDGVRADGELVTKTYAKYHQAGSDDGYVDLTDKSASSYKINLEEAGSKAVTLQIVSYTYDDKGNAAIYGETINISNTTDNAAPKLKEVVTNDDAFVSEYQQGQEIELPSMVVLDDAVAYMSFDVNVYYVNGDVRTRVATYDYSSKREVLSKTGAGRFTVNAGKFVASFAGKYEVSISVKDSKNNTVVSFVNYDVKARTIIQPPVINTSLESKTVELDGDSNYDPETGIEIPTPSVSYQIPNSVTYDLFSENESEYADTDFVVKGVDQNGKATNASVTFGTVGGAFKPEAVGEYSIRYTVNLTVYNHKVFSYKEMTCDIDSETYDEGGYYVFSNNEATANVVLNENGEYEVVVDGASYIVKKVDGVAKIYDASSGDEFTSIGSSSALYGVDFDSWFDNLKNYTLNSDVYTIIVKDTKGPEIIDYDYVDIISSEEIAATDGYKLKIYKIESSEEIGDSSKVVISWKLANGETGSYTFGKLMEDKEYTIKANGGNVLDGTYTITYTVYDQNGNYSTKAYTIAVGDNEPPVLTFDDDFVEDKYTIGSELKIDLTKIHCSDNRPFQDGAKPVVTLTNTSTSAEIEETQVGDTMVYKMETVGTYTLTVEIEDAVGNKTTKTFSIEVTAKDKNTVSTYKVVGTILIVISVLVLVGVIVYFVVSKVKLDKELKK